MQDDRFTQKVPWLMPTPGIITVCSRVFDKLVGLDTTRMSFPSIEQLSSQLSRYRAGVGAFGGWCGSKHCMEAGFAQECPQDERDTLFSNKGFRISETLHRKPRLADNPWYGFGMSS